MLAAWPEIELVLAARGLEALNVLSASLLAQGSRAQLKSQVFDRTRPDALAGLRPWLVVDAAGPFQNSGYDLALAAVRCGAHYVDLADGRAFVAGFKNALAGAAAEAGVLAVTGASSTPALSHAALELLVEGWRAIDAVTVAISPGARAPRGVAVVQAILSYVGQPVRVFRNGAWGYAAGWSGLRSFDMPGLGRRLTSICETPDLDLLPQRFPIQRSALFRAGLEPAPLHLSLSFLSLSVRSGLIASLQPFAGLLRLIASAFVVFGSDRGGMIVEASGEDAQGRPIHARWSLWADAGAGPNTPPAPAAALVRALVDDRETRRGALVCAGLLTRGDIMRELAAFPIHTRLDECHVNDPALFRRLLGRRFDALPPAVRTVHGAGEPTVFTGRAIARAGRSLPARITRLLLGLPRSGRHAVKVTLMPDRGGETWTRQFGVFRFASRLADTSQMTVFEEQFGPLRFAFDLRQTARGVVWTMVRWSVLGVPAPLWIAPRMHARAEDVDGRYRFCVAVAHPWVGLLFAYRGELAC